MKDQIEFDAFLLCLRAWVMETSGNGPNSKSAWFRHQIYNLFPGFVLWCSQSPDHALPQEPQTKERQALRLVH